MFTYLFQFEPTTSLPTIVCAPGRRYVHPHNCSAFIMCRKNRSPEIFKCPTGLHYNAKKSYCDWPEIAKCTLEEKKETVLESSRMNKTSVGKDNEKIIVQKTKTNDKVRYITMRNKDAAALRGKSENKTTDVQTGVLNKSQPKEHQHNESKKEVKGGDAKIETPNNGSKGVDKNADKDNTEEITASDTLTNRGHSENVSNLEVKSGKSKTEVKDNAQENASERGFDTKKQGFFSKGFHSISKRQDKFEIKQEKNKKTNDKKIEIEKTNVTKVENNTSDEKLSYKEKELDFSNKSSIIDFVLKTNNTGVNQNNKEGLEEPVVKNNSDGELVSVPVNVNYMQGVFGYEIIPINTENSTSESGPQNESAPSSENSPEIENSPTTESSLTSEGTSKSEGVPTRKSASQNTSEP